MSDIPKGKYPGINELQTFIYKYINEACVSKEISDDLSEAREKLKDGKGEYFQYLYLYTALKDILMEHNYGFPDPLFEDENKDNIYKLISDLLSSVEAKHCLNISFNQNTPPEEGNLFGLLQDDFNIDISKKKLMHQNIQQVLIPQVEKRLKCLSLELYRFSNPMNDDSEGLALAKANKFPHFVMSEKEKIEEAKNSMKDEEIKYEEIYQEYFNKICKSLDELEDDYLGNNDMQYLETNKVNIEWLTSKCDFVLGKVKVMKNRLDLQTYTKENTEALKKIRYHLTKEIKQTREEIQKTQHSLNVYESVGDTFTKLLNEYTHLTIDIDNKKWALAELKSSKSVE